MTRVVNEFEQTKPLAATLGGFWNEVYDRRDQVHALVAARAAAARQSAAAAETLLHAISREKLPVYEQRYWTPLVLRKSDQRSTTALAKYDGTYRHDGFLRYDVPVASRHSVFPKPAGLATAPILTNRFTAPTIVWVHHLDFQITDDGLVFRTDPFRDDRVPKQDVYDSQGVVVDQEAVLWIYRGSFDRDYVYQHYGYAIGLRLPPTEAGKRLVNIVYDSLVGGTSEFLVRNAVATALGVPIVESDMETVETVTRDARGVLVITDRAVYRFHPNAVATVQPGDVVRRGDTLTNVLRFADFRRGIVPDWLPALAVNRSWLGSCFYSDLIFDNADVPLVVEADHAGMTRVSFALGGFPMDVAHFFDEVHARGVAAATVVDEDCVQDTSGLIAYYTDTGAVTYRRPGTLAHALDRRSNRVGEPTAASLPETINPLAFLASNVLRYNTCVVAIKADMIETDSPGMAALAAVLRRIMPPQTALILVVEASPDADVHETAEYESLAQHRAMVTIEDTVPSTDISELRYGLRPVTGIYR